MGANNMDKKEEKELRKELSNAGAGKGAIDREIIELKKEEKERVGKEDLM